MSKLMNFGQIVDFRLFLQIKTLTVTALKNSPKESALKINKENDLLKLFE